MSETIAQGISKIVTIKKQSGLGVPAIGSGGQILRRKSATFGLAKDTYESAEIVSHQQSTGAKHGLRKVSGKLDGELSPSTYSDLIASLVRRDFVATAPITAVDLTIAVVTGNTYTINRATGSFLTDDIKIGDVIRLSIGTLAAANIDKNLIVLSVGTNEILVKPLNGTAMTPETVTGCTVTVVGKKTMAPKTGHTKDYYTVEEWYEDITVSKLFTDNMVASVDFSLPSTGIATAGFTFAGLNRVESASQQLTTPTPETTTPLLVAVDGIIILNGGAVGFVTGASIKVDGSTAAMGAVIGSNSSPDVQRGRIKVSGQITAYFKDGVVSGLYDAAAKTNIILVISDGAAKDADFLSFNLSAIRFGSDDVSDGEQGLVQTISYVGELNTDGGTDLANDATIFTMQDSTLV